MVEIMKSKALAVVNIIFFWSKKSNGVVKRVLVSLENGIVISIMQ